MGDKHTPVGREYAGDFTKLRSFDASSAAAIS